MKKTSLVIRLMIPVLFFLIGIGCLGCKDSIASAGGYQINAFDCHYRISEDNTYHVTETIHVTFTELRHGIYRNIPELCQVKRKDGSEDTVVASVTNIKCSDPFVDSREKNDRMIKIGDENETLIGEHTYTISYDYVWGEDRVDGADEFYMNLIGDGWDVPIYNVSFTLELPGPFDAKKAGMSYGNYGSEQNEGIYYQIDNLSIKGYLADYAIMPGEFFTVRMEFEDGYFVASGDLPINVLSALVLCCVFLAVSLLIWIIFGRDPGVIDVYEYYPPEGMNCAEMAYAYFGELPQRHMIPMFITLAEKGFLSIEQTDKKGERFVLHILKQYDGDNEAERIFMFGLAQYGTTITKTELAESFYKTLNLVSNSIIKKWKDKLFHVSTLRLRYLTFLFSLAPYVIGLYYPYKTYNGSSLWGFGIPIGFWLSITFATYRLGSKGSTIGKRIGGVLIGLAAFAFLIWFGSDELNYYGKLYWILLLACAIANGFQSLFFGIIDKRTEYGIQLLGRIRGFRRYLADENREHMGSILEQDPEYYYKVLPYAYVLGVTDELANMCEGFRVQPPSWFFGPGIGYFNLHSFNLFMNNTVATATSAMTSTPSSSGSGGSGGGFSGGGGGGGGGGSW